MEESYELGFRCFGYVIRWLYFLRKVIYCRGNKICYMEVRVFVYKWLGEEEVFWEKFIKYVNFELYDKVYEVREDIGKKWYISDIFG